MSPQINQWAPKTWLNRWSIHPSRCINNNPLTYFDVSVYIHIECIMVVVYMYIYICYIIYTSFGIPHKVYCTISTDYIDFYHLNIHIWRFPKTGVPLNNPFHFRIFFPANKPPSYCGTPMIMKTPISLGDMLTYLLYKVVPPPVVSLFITRINRRYIYH